MEYIETLGISAKNAAPILADCGTNIKNRALSEIAKRLRESVDGIIAANRLDIENAKKSGMAAAMVDRLTLDVKRIAGIAEGVEQIVSLSDPIGEVIGGGELPNGLRVVQKRVPMGVIGIIFESRPNVTVDAAALCFKAGSAVILRGGSDAINSNKFLVSLMRGALAECGVPEDCIQLVEDTSRDTATAMMRLNRYIDLLIPRGSGRLIRSVIENATVPVIQTGEGNCHVYIDESADIEMAVDIVDNAKTQDRKSVV